MRVQCHGMKRLLEISRSEPQHWQADMLTSSGLDNTKKHPGGCTV
ncbi:hypothetical protein HanPI659440_Chr03g0114021 [Helianthus annuus]|nr:hypothetical protein HanPI659440_Chr03g0114021 [Helianthus annuus]